MENVQPTISPQIIIHSSKKQIILWISLGIILVAIAVIILTVLKKGNSPLPNQPQQPSSPLPSKETQEQFQNCVQQIKISDLCYQVIRHRSKQESCLRLSQPAKDNCFYLLATIDQIDAYCNDIANQSLSTSCMESLGYIKNPFPKSNRNP